MKKTSHFLTTRIGLLAAAFALFTGSVAPASAALKPVPRGIYDLLFGAAGTGKIDLTGHPLLDNPNIDGFRYKTGWAKIQPTDGNTYNWSSIDAAIAIAAANGKKMCISIAAGFSTPSWVYTTAPVVYKYQMTEIDRNTGLPVGDQPLPWDTAYQEKWAKFIAAFGARYDSNPACSYVVIGGFMETFNTVMAATDEDFNAMEAIAKNPPPGYPGLTTSYADFSAAYIPAAQQVVGMYGTNFPTTSFLLTLIRVVPGDLGVTLQNVVPAWARDTYPGQFGTMVSALYATTAPHAPPPAPLPYPKGHQMVCHTSDPARLYLDPDPVPMPRDPIPLQDALEHAVSLGSQYVEVYEDDLTNPVSQAVLAAERLKLHANVSPDGVPAAPTNLRITP